MSGLLSASKWPKMIFEELRSDGEGRRSKKICWSVALLTGGEKEPWGPHAGEGMLWGGGAPGGATGKAQFVYP